MNIDRLEWDDENIAHIARHGVNPQEVEGICLGLNIFTREKGGRYILGGQSQNGGYLIVVLEKLSQGWFRPITAFEMDEKDKRNFRRRVGR